MKIKLAVFLVLFAAMGGSSSAQQQQSSFSNPLGGDIRASSTNCSVPQSCVWQKLGFNAGTVTVTIAGTFSATLPVEQSSDGVTFTTVATLSTPGTSSYSAAGMSDFRVRASAYTSGTASVTLAWSTSGGGGGTQINSYTVATLPAGPATGTLAIVTDGSGVSCTAGGASTRVLCQYTGAVWAVVSGGSGSAPPWSAITSPAGNLPLAMGANTTTFTWNSATGAGANLFNLVDGANNTGTGFVFNVNLASGSAAKPAQFAVNGNGIQVTNAGLASKVGTGGFDYGSLLNLPAACGANLFATQVALTPVCSAAVVASSAPANQFATAISAGGALSYAQPSFSNLSGSVALAQTPLTTNGDLLSVSGGVLARVASAGGQDFLLQGASAAVPVWLAVNNCGDATHAISYSTTTHVFGCQAITTLANPMTTLGDMIMGGASGVVTRLAGPASPNGLAYTLVSVPAGGVATAPVWSLAGVPVNTQSGTTYTILATDRANYINTSNASPITFTLPLISGNFASNFPFVTQNIGAGASTLTPTSPNTINGNTTDLVPSKGAAFVYQDSTPNWFTIKFPTLLSFPSCLDSSGQHLNFNNSTLAFSCGTTTSGTAFYQTVDANAAAQTQRPILNLISGTNATVTCADNGGATRTDCTISASSSAGSRLDQITGATATNTINSTTFAQVWNCAPTGSLICMQFGENTAATGAGNIILNAKTLSTSTALPFQTTAGGTANGWNLSTAALWEPIGTGALATGLTAHTVPINEGATTAIAAVGPGTAGQVFVSNGGAADQSFIDFPQIAYAPAADCVNGVASSGWSTGATPAALCRAGTNNKDGLLSPWGASDVGYFKVHLPNDWDSAASLDLSIDLTSTSTTNAQTIIMQAASSCGKGDGSTTDDVAFNTAQSFGTITLNGVANRTWNATLTGLTKTGCTAGSTLWVKISRTTDTASNVGVYGATVDLARLIKVQAN